MNETPADTIPKKVCLSAIRQFEEMTGLRNTAEFLVKRGIIEVVYDDKPKAKP